MYRKEEDLWSTIAMAAIASGRKTAAEAAQTADELLRIHKERWPDEDAPKTGGPGQPYGT